MPSTAQHEATIPAEVLVVQSDANGLGLNVLGVYRIPCECGKVYVGQTGRSIETRCKEHRRHICLDQPDKSAVAKHSINTGHCLDFSYTLVLDRTSSYMDRLVKEAIGIRLNNQNFSQNHVTTDGQSVFVSRPIWDS
jgi:hypothetical protein